MSTTATLDEIVGTFSDGSPLEVTRIVRFERYGPLSNPALSGFSIPTSAIFEGV